MISSSDHLQKLESFRIKHDDDKFFSRLLSKENSKANPSFRVYYGNLPGSVPFMWESRPGTPKHTFSDNSLPPLAPPPSYYFTSINAPHKNHSSRSRLLNLFLAKIHRNKFRIPSSPSCSSSSLSSLSWSSSFHSSSTPLSNYCKRRRFWSRGSSFDEGGADHHQQQQEEKSNGSWNPGMCFGIINKNIEDSNGIRVDGYSVVMKKALLSIVGRS